MRMFANTRPKSVIAVTGLSGHAMGSWRNLDSQKNWLRDFLSEDITHLRTMTYGSATSLVDGSSLGSDSRIIDHRRDFIENILLCVALRRYLHDGS